MSESFAAGAARLAGLVARALGWRPDDFWTATPAELAAILASDGDIPAAGLGRDELTTLMERDRDG